MKFILSASMKLCTHAGELCKQKPHFRFLAAQMQIITQKLY